MTGGAGETNAVTQMQNFTLKISSCTVTQPLVSLAERSWNQGSRSHSRSLCDFCFPDCCSHLWTPNVHSNAALAVQRKKKVVRNCVTLLPHRLAILAPTLKQRPAAAAMRGQFGAPRCPRGSGPGPWSNGGRSSRFGFQRPRGAFQRSTLPLFHPTCNSHSAATQ